MLMDLVGHHQLVYHQLTTIVYTALSKHDVCPFILLVGPYGVGSFDLVKQLIDDVLNSRLPGSHDVPVHIMEHDIAWLYDLSDQRHQVKAINDLPGGFHLLQLDVDHKRHTLELPNGSQIRNRSVRDLQDWLVHSPTGSHKIVAIEGLHRANTSSYNALLKTLEEPLPRRLIIATADHLEQLPATIISRAMVFRVDPVADEQMNERLCCHYPHYSQHTHEVVLMLAAGRPGVVQRYEQLGQLDHLVQQWDTLVEYWKQQMIAPLHQHLLECAKGGSLLLLSDALLVYASRVKDHILYDATLDLIRTYHSNVTIDNLIFQWCLRVVKS